MPTLLISTYDLGRQPFGLASPAGWLREAGVEVTCVDLSRETLSDDVVRRADLIGFFLPMHTATRLAMPVIDRVRRVNPGARVCAYGLYAPLNAALLQAHGVSQVLHGEFEQALLDLALHDIPASPQRTRDEIPRLRFRVPDRSGLPPLERYATLQVGSIQRTTGYTEASRGCKHRCRHCPIVPVYDGRFRVVPVDVVLADIRTQVRAGARHITFGDPDFFNGIGHARAVIEAFARECAGVSYDVTIKIEHLLEHADMLPELKRSGCAFVTSAVESIDDGVLRLLEKGHTRTDFERVVELCRAADLTLAPTFVAFTPWTTIAGYCELLQTIDRLGLVDHVATIQLAIRLLVTGGSRLLELADIKDAIDPFDARTLTYPWRHPDARVDALQRRIADMVPDRVGASRREMFAAIWDLAHAQQGQLNLVAIPGRTDVLPRAAIPYLNEPWYC